jgi:hypothetical protein
MVSLGCYGRSGAAVPCGTAGAVEDRVLTVLESDLAAFRCRVKPRSRVREEASVDGASRLAPPPECSKNSFFRESAEVFCGPEEPKATSVLPNQGLGRPKSCSRAKGRSFRAFGKVGWPRRVKLSHLAECGHGFLRVAGP